MLKVLKSMVNSWSRRKLSWIGKITVIKTLILSKINYAISSLETPAWFITEVETIVYNFLWSNKPAHVKNNVMTNDYNNGGLRMTDINLYIKSQKMSWIKRLLENDCTVPCKFVSHFIDMKLNDFLKCNIADDQHYYDMPLFYKEVFNAWFSCKQEPNTYQDVIGEVIWHNRYIMINNRSIFIKPLYDNGLIYIHDILDKNNAFISHTDLITKYGNHITCYSYLCLKHAIPQKWKCLIRDTNCNVTNFSPKDEMVAIQLGQQKKPVTLSKSKHVYKAIKVK